MKYGKTLLLAIMILLLTSIGALADTAPTQYIEDNLVKTLPAGVTPTQITSSPITANSVSQNGGTWVWAGQDSSGIKEVTNITLNANGASASNPCAVNIIVGSNGSANTPAMRITNSNNGESTWTIPKNVTVNIYAAATNNNTITEDKKCFFSVINSNTTTGAAINVDGGTLNIESGGLEAKSNSSSTQTPGLLVSGGQVNINDGELEGNTNSGSAYSNEANAINITGGNINVAGGYLTGGTYRKALTTFSNYAIHPFS